MTARLFPYEHATLLQRVLSVGRPYICPPRPLHEAIPPGSSVLDIGSGMGLLLVGLAKAGAIARGVGCDPNEKAVSVARQASGKMNGAALTFLTTRSNDDIPDGPFDVVTVVDVMHHVPPAGQEAFFAAAVDRVRPGGLLVYKDMTQSPWWMNWGNRLHDLVLARQWIHYVSLETVKRWSSARGLSLVNEARYSRFWYGHELLVFSKAA